MRPQNLVLPEPKVESHDKYAIHHEELIQVGEESPVQLKFGESAMETYDEPLAVKVPYNISTY